MTLYVRQVSPGGKVSYVPDKPTLDDTQISTAQAVSLMTTLVVSMLMSVSDQLPPHARTAREIKRLEEAVVRFASLNSTGLDPAMVEVGVSAWNAALTTTLAGLGRLA